MSILKHLEQMRKEQDAVTKARKRETAEDIAMGTTARMRSYCLEHGIYRYPDLKVIWKLPRRNRVWKVGKQGR